MTSNQFTAEVAAQLPGPEWLQTVREQAIKALDTVERPSESEEVWRYSRIDELDLDRYRPITGRPIGDQPPTALADLIESTGERAALIATWNGSVIRTEVDDALAAKGLVVQGPDTWADGHGYGSVAEAKGLFGHLNNAFGAEPVLIDIPAGLVVETPIVIVHWVGEDGVAVFPRVVVRAGENSQATICEYLESPSDIDALVVPVTEVDVAQASNVSYVNLQALGKRVWQVGFQASRVERDATFNSTSVALGGDYARVRTDSHLLGQGSTSNLRAVYFGGGNQMHDFRTLQAHEAPKSTSDLLFKGAVGDTARSVYSGLIRVRKGASGTNAYQTNRNLVLSPGAHADSVPNLEIEENDVRCSHASAVGPVDEDQQYYLESRGVPTDVAQRLIVLGFLDEILSTIPVPGLRATLRQAVALKLDQISQAVPAS